MRHNHGIWAVLGVRVLEFHFATGSDAAHCSFPFEGSCNRLTLVQVAPSCCLSSSFHHVSRVGAHVRSDKVKAFRFVTGVMIAGLLWLLLAQLYPRLKSVWVSTGSRRTLRRERRLPGPSGGFPGRREEEGGGGRRAPVMAGRPMVPPSVPDVYQ